MSPDGRTAYVANFGRFGVFPAGYTTHTQAGNTMTPRGTVFSPDGRRGFVALSGANQIAVIDVASRSIMRTIDTGLEPDGIAWATIR